MTSILEWSDPDTEQKLLGELSLDEPWALVEHFTGLVRESGTEDERRAAAYVADRLEALGIAHQVFTPTLYISLPRGAGLTVLGPEQRTLHAKTPSFSASTGDTPVKGSVVYLPSGFAQSDAALFEGGVQATAAEVAGKIALTEDLPTPRKVADLSNLGAVGAIFISPGERIHEGISTSIWGAPDLDSDGRQPRIPIVSINRGDGTWLTELCRAGLVEVALSTRLEGGWMPCPLIVAEISGTEEPERFVLVHGHIDSWHVGIGDNATGDAALLELARIFHRQRGRLKRSIRIAWWPGHSTGRYAGSTWYADRFGLDLMENCIAQVNVDSPGCRWATAYLDIDWSPEADAFAKRAIRDATGLPAEGERPTRAGDYSFNNIGLTSFFMLLSTMPPEARAEHGYYVVGGCGGNIAWHTEDDTLEIADPDTLLRDLRVYVTAISRAANAPLHPFDFRAHAADIAATLHRYAALAGDRVDLSTAIAEADGLHAALDRFYSGPDGNADGKTLAYANAVQRELARHLVPINFSRAGLFRHDPALEQPPLPDLAPVTQLSAVAPGSHQAHVLTTHLVRGHNRVAWTLRRARRLVESALEDSGQ